MRGTLHILIAVVGSRGDVHPFLPIARALQRRGHDVQFLINAYHEPMIRRGGLECDLIGTAEEHLRLLKHRDFWHPQRCVKVLLNDFAFGSMRAFYDAIAKRDVPGRTIVLASTLAVGARVAGEALGIPLATVHASPAPLRWLGVGEREDALWDRYFAKPLNAFRVRLGLPPVRRVMSSWWNSQQLVVGTFPGWFAPPEPYWPSHVHATGFPLYDEGDVTEAPVRLEQFLRSGPAPVVITPSASMRSGERFIRSALEGCKILGQRALILTSHTDQVPRDLPPDVLHVPYAPFGALLPRCAAIVHQAGIGTIALALAAGIMQVAVPVAHDQPLNGELLSRLGTARVLTTDSASPAAIAAALGELSGCSRSRARAAHLARRLATTGERPVDRAVELVESLAAHDDSASCTAQPAGHWRVCS